jgi:hypothetical protein
MFIGTSFVKLTGGQSHIMHGKRNVDLTAPLGEIKDI